MRFLVMFCLLMLGLRIVNSDDVQAELYPYRYTGNNCTTGLMANMPFNLEGFVRIPGDISDTENDISIEWRGLKQTEFGEFHIILRDCNDSEIFFCKPLEGKLGYFVYLRTLAKENLSQSEWRLKGTHKRKPFFSNVIITPKIYNDISMRVNEQEWFKENTSLTVNSEKLRICCHDGPSPCEAFVSINSKPMVTDSPCVTQAIEISGGETYADVKFGFRACADDNFSKTYSVAVKMEPQGVSENVSRNTKIIVLGVVLATVVLALLGLLLYLPCKSYFGKKKKEENNQDNTRSSKPLIHGKSLVKDKSTRVNMVPESQVIGSTNKGKKNKGAKPTRETAPDKSADSVTRKRSISESENNTIRDSRKAQTKATRRMKTK